MTRILAIGALLVLAPGLARSQEPPDPGGLELFETKIRPVLVERCYSCHSAKAEKLKGALLLDTKAGLLKGGETGPAIVPGDPEKSLLVKAIRYRDEDLKMPPKGRLAADVVADFEAWIRRGAADPRAGGAAAAPKKRVIDVEEGRKYWAFRPLGTAAPPAVRDGAWVKTPVDRFILARLEEKGIAPNGNVDRRRLIRRATFDLTGLPPTPEEIDAFVTDVSPDAVPKLLDRLLASPAYGERWARHWLDLARFAESHGFEQDYDREGAYAYRDFVIRALNGDMPFTQFVQWQVAGDELAPADPLAWMATGFLGAGAFPTQLTEAEFESARYDELDNMASTTGQAMLGLSVGCARCHDHKFDPIPSEDYYRLVSTFTTAIRTSVDFDLDPEASKKASAAWEKEHAPLRSALQAFEKEELPGRFEAWVAGKPWESQGPPAWTILEVAARSQGGATFVPQSDGSLLATGQNPDHDKWTFTARTSLTGITAVRLEALADPSLKKNGPGRGDNGNFALCDVRITAKPSDGKGTPVSVKLVSAKADFEQNATNLSAAAAIDQDKGSGWAVDPQFGKSHALVIEVEPPVGFPGGTVLVFDFEYNLNVRHAIGRPRLSITTRARPVGMEGEGRLQAVSELLERLKAGGARDAEALAVYKTLDPGWQQRNREVQDHLARKPAPKTTKVLVTTEGLKPEKHHADDRGFPHFYPQTHILARGDVNKKQGIAAQGFLRVLMNSPEQEKHWIVEAPRGSRTPLRRAALARWLTDLEAGAGVLLARVIVNRLWAHHLGRGIVPTTNDFGVQGEPPTHPELLDWLAGELVRSGWSLKSMHKLLMSSAIYLETTATDPAKARLDPDNRLFWRRGSRRLEGEAIRDSMLAVSGLLDRTMYGPGTLDEGMARRSVYFFVKRSRLIPMMMVFDAPEPLVSMGSRPTTTIAPQALLFMNSPHVRRYAAAFAKRLPAAPEEAVREAYRLALGRLPSEAESALAAAALAKGMTAPDFCQALFSTNEFVYPE
jgi:hypothetical protein